MPNYVPLPGRSPNTFARDGGRGWRPKRCESPRGAQSAPARWTISCRKPSHEARIVSWRHATNCEVTCVFFAHLSNREVDVRVVADGGAALVGLALFVHEGPHVSED